MRTWINFLLIILVSCSVERTKNKSVRRNQKREFEITINKFSKALKTKNFAHISHFLYKPDGLQIFMEISDSMRNESFISSTTKIIDNQDYELNISNNDSIIVLCAGVEDEILGYTGGYYFFVKQDKKYKFLKFNFPK